jgi:hypothetical protein
MSKLTEGSVGPAEKRKLNPGDEQHFYFRDGEENGTGMPDPPPWYKPTASLDEYLGKAKGKKQILWERGLWVDGMVDKIAEEDTRGQALSMTHALECCEDFEMEVTALQELVSRSGHILVMTPKGHCELAGQGIECCWGKSKKYYRRHNHTYARGSFKKLVIESMSRKNLGIRTARTFARVARAYLNTYATGIVTAHADVERMRKVFRAHRNALDFAGKLIDES